MVTKIKKSKIVCVSHKEDADGISSAALIKQAFGGETILVDYPGMMDDMEPLRTDEKLKELYICDVGLNKKNESDFVELLTQLRKRRVKVSYIDHHDLDEEKIKKTEENLKSGSFSLEDYLSQLRQMKKMGGMEGVLSMLPGVSKIKKQMDNANIDESIIKINEAIILSMTKEERQNPKIINSSKKLQLKELRVFYNSPTS